MRSRAVWVLVVLGPLVLTGCGSAPPSDAAFDISMRYSKFSPASVTVRAGSTVTFRLRNDDPIVHEFVLGDEAEQRRHETGAPENHDGKPGQATIDPGETDTVTYTFARAGTVIFGCHRPGHYAYGMRGVVDVAR